jgi:hypothetical protein
MVLKFKVWRIGQQKFGSKNYLTLRDKEGRIRKVAKTPEEECSILTWYEKYSVGKRLEQLLAVRRLKDHVRRIKANVRKRGFTKQLSVYGITKNEETKQRHYRRYEIFKAYPYTREEVSALHDLFHEHPPKSQAGVFIYHNDKLYVVESDKVTTQGTGTLGYQGERRNPVTD